MPEVRRHRAGAAPREGTALRPRGHERLGLRSAIQGSGHPPYVPLTLAHGTRVRPRKVRVGEPPRLRVRKPCPIAEGERERERERERSGSSRYGRRGIAESATGSIYSPECVEG